MAINITNLGTNAAPDYETGVDATSYANASWTPPTTGLILLWVYNTRSTTLGSAPTVSGNNITWLNLGSDGIDTGSVTHRCTLFAAKAAGATTGQTTVSFGADTQSSCVMCFCHVTGADTTGTTLNAFQQTTTNNGNSTTLTVTLAAAASTANRFACGIGHGDPENTSAENGWTELDDLGGSTPGHQLMTFWNPSTTTDVTPTATWTTSRACAGVATEIKELASAETSTLTNTVGVTDSITKVVQYARTLTNSVGITDAISKIMGYVKTLANSVGITDSVLAEFGSGVNDWVITITNTVNITDTRAKVITYLRTLTNTVGITTLLLAEIEHFGREFLDGIRSLYTSLSGKRNLYTTLKGKRDKDNTIDGNTQ